MHDMEVLVHMTGLAPPLAALLHESSGERGHE